MSSVLWYSWWLGPVGFPEGANSPEDSRAGPEWPWIVAVVPSADVQAWENLGVQWLRLILQQAESTPGVLLVGTLAWVVPMFPHIQKLSQNRSQGGAPEWLSWLSYGPQLRSWSRSLWVQAPPRALDWQPRAWSLLQILCLPLSLCLPCSYSVSLCLSIIKIKKNFFN